MVNKCVTLTELGFTDDEPERVIGNHCIMMKSHRIDLQHDTKIYRYMRLSTLLDMLFYGIIHVPNRMDMTDLREKQGLNDVIDGLSSFEKVPSYKEQLLIKKMGMDKRRALSVCISCWTLDRRNSNSCDESFLMWKAYSKDEIICRIGTTIGQLIECV